MKEERTVPQAVLHRLPRYYRYLGDLLDEGVERISSSELGERMGSTASQIRQDLNYFGGFGHQGYGYNVARLYSEMAEILGVSEAKSAIILGMGRLGSAIVNRITFEKRGFNVIGVFDNREDIIGTDIGGFVVRDISTLEQFCLENKPQSAFLTLPREVAPEMALKLEELGVQGFWNFSSGYIRLNDPTIPVENMHFGDSLMTLSCRMQKRAAKAQED